MSSVGEFTIKVMDGWDAQLDADIEVALEAVGLQAEGYAKLELENSPRRVDTGLLRNSITHAVSGKPTAIKGYHASYGSNKSKKTGKRLSAKSKNAGIVKMGRYSGSAPADDKDHMSVYIGTNVEYAPYVHFGTMRMTPNEFLKNAMEKNKGKYKKMIESYLAK